MTSLTTMMTLVSTSGRLEASSSARAAIEAWMKAKGWRFKYTPEIPPLTLQQHG
jgi:hypothetical protein